MKTAKIAKGLGKLAVFVACVTVLSAIGFELGDSQEPVASIWLTNGFALAALMSRPPRDWPWLVGATGFGVAVADLTRYGAIHPFVVVPMFVPLLAVWIVHRFSGQHHTPPTLRSWIRTMLGAPVVAAGIGAVGSAVIIRASYPSHDFVALVRSLWFADALGMLIVSPALLALLDPNLRRETRRMIDEQRLEFAVCIALLFGVTLVAFGTGPQSPNVFRELHYAVVTILIWAALRFPAWVSYDGLALLAGYAVWQMKFGHGPFVVAGQGELARHLAYQVPTLMTAIGVQMIQVLAAERRKTLDELSQSEHRFRDIVESTNEWLWEIDSDMRFVYSSPHCQSIVGYTPEELVGTDCMALVLPEDRETGRHAFDSKVMNLQPVQGLIHRSRHKDGRIVYLESNVMPIVDEQGRFVVCRGTDRDVSERIAAEAAAALQLEEKRRSEKLVALGTVVSGVAHEINNPNQFITLNMPILRQGWSDVAPAIEAYATAHGDWKIAGLAPEAAKVEIADAIEEVAEGSGRIRTIIAELRDFMSGDSNREHEPIDLEKSVRSAVHVLAPSIAARGQRVTIENPPPLARATGSRRRIEQILINLIANASEALDSEPGTIAIRLAPTDDGKQVRVEVIDDGPGISTVDLARAMDPFFTTKRAIGGTGLGLAISSRIAEEHGGRIELASEPGKGTTARLILPVSA